MSWPKDGKYLDFLLQKGIQHIVCFAPECRPPVGNPPRNEFIFLEIPVDEFSAPTLNQVRQFIEFCEKHQGSSLLGLMEPHDDKPVQRTPPPIALHCRQGLGRTGAFAACYLVRFFGLTPEMAILQVRKVRPYSIETYSQERIVFHYYNFLCTNPPENDDCWKPAE